MTIDTKNAKFAKNCVFRDGMNEAKAREMEIRHTVPLMRNEEVVEYPADQSTLTQRYTVEATKFIRDNQAKPFFIYLPHTMVHVPLAASDAFRGKSDGGLLGDAVEELDWSVGQIMQTLKELKLDEKTLVIFTSDNGAATGSSAPYRGKKATNFEGGVREPCIMRWPGKIPAGTTCEQIAGNIDLLPTFAKLVGVETAKDRTLDGRDITSLMFDAKAGPVRDTHLYYTARETMAAIRQGDWKLFLAGDGGAMNQKKAAKNDKKKGEANSTEPALYNLASDPVESKNVAAENPEIVKRLQAEAAKRGEEIQKNRRPAGSLKNQ
jgi:arylsulfatase A